MGIASDDEGLTVVVDAVVFEEGEAGCGLLLMLIVLSSSSSLDFS